MPTYREQGLRYDEAEYAREAAESRAGRDDLTTEMPNMTDLDAMHWLDRGLAEVDAAETLEEARDEARGLVIYAGVRLSEHAESAWLLGLSRDGTGDGHPFAAAVKSFKIAHNKLQDVCADIRRQASALAGE